VDVSIISQHDAGTGIQRVVRSVSGELTAKPPEGWDVVLVTATRRSGYCPVSEKKRGQPAAIRGRPGDIFLGLDFAIDSVRIHRQQLLEFKRGGGQLWFVMYDLLPAQRPEWFSRKLTVRFRRWLGVLAALADGFYCISAHVEKDLRYELASYYRLDRGFRTQLLPMGADLRAINGRMELRTMRDTVVRGFSGRRAALMVGTLEPRKGHADILAAFELLWQRGRDYVLVIAGRPGWKTDALQESLRSHSESKAGRLIWLQNADDEMLAKLYGACDGLIAASHAEGFGLPVIEALAYGKRVLARAVPAFLAHQPQGVTYFPEAASTPIIADAIETWLRGGCSGSALPRPTIPTWADAARGIAASLA